MISCDKAAELLSAWQDEEVNDVELALLEEHLSSCQACKSLKERFRAVDQLVLLSSAQPGRGLKDKIGWALELKVRPHSPNRLFRIAAAAVVLIAISLMILVMSDQADATRVKKELSSIDAINNEVLEDQDALLKSFEWELSAMKLMMDYSDLEEDKTKPIKDRINTLMEEIRRVREDKK